MGEKERRLRHGIFRETAENFAFAVSRRACEEVGEEVEENEACARLYG